MPKFSEGGPLDTSTRPRSKGRERKGRGGALITVWHVSSPCLNPEVLKENQSASNVTSACAIQKFGIRTSIQTNLMKLPVGARIYSPPQDNLFNDILFAVSREIIKKVVLIFKYK
jgi:hypothetical protein